MDNLRFKELLKELSISQVQLAELLEVNKVTISNWKSDSSYPAWLEDFLTGQVAKKRLNKLKDLLEDI